MTISGMSNHTSNNHSNGPPTIRPARPEILNGIRNFLNGSSYREVIESSSSYNNNIVHERKLRLPYLDSQTGVAQSDCFLWFNRADRRPGTESGQLYTYPAKRWKKKRRQYLMNDSYLTRGRQPVPHNLESSSTNFDHHDSNSNLSSDGLQGNPGLTKNEPGMNSNASEVTNGNSSSNKFGFHRDDSKDSWYDYEDGSDLPDAGELDDESDFDDSDEYTTSRRKKKPKEKTPRRKRAEYSDAEKPFACEVCGARYKTRPGLSYHYTHSHQVENPELLVQQAANAVPADGHGQEGGGGMPFTPPRQPLPTPPHLTGPGVASNQGQPSPGIPAMVAGTNVAGSRASPLPSSVSNAGATTGTESPNTTTSSASSQDGFAGNRPAGKGTVAPPQDYCDFCLGDTAENKKTKSAESLVSCSDCGRSAHPTCLQFTPNMIASVKKYRWQCIECKSCGLCGTSDNDDQLLFCDDCDRGYHMYCLKPPLSEPPEGSWSCHLCIVEYHSNPVPQDTVPQTPAAEKPRIEPAIQSASTQPSSAPEPSTASPPPLIAPSSSSSSAPPSSSPSAPPSSSSVPPPSSS